MANTEVSAASNIAVANIKARLPMPQGLEGIDRGVWRVLCESIFPSAKQPESVVMAVQYCRARKLDIMKRPVNIVPMWNSSLRKEVETVWPSINEVQVTAARTGQYAGLDEPRWGPDVTRVFKGTRKFKDEDGKWKEENSEKSVTFPEWCSVTVYRLIGGTRCPFTEPVYWLEAYAKMGKTDVPNDMWAKRPRGQLLKVAKAFSLRAAFPEEGEYVAEEMEGKEIHAGGVVIEGEPAPDLPAAFPSDGSRALFVRNVLKSIEESLTAGDLENIGVANTKKLGEMRIGTEADQKAVEEIREIYAARLKLLRSSAPPTVDSVRAALDGDDIPDAWGDGRE